MTSQASFWIVAGPNGAGKTTTVQKEPIGSLIPDVTFLNPDNITLIQIRKLGYSGFHDTPPNVLFECFIDSANMVYDNVETFLKRGQAVGVETVLSSDKYCNVVGNVVNHGGFFGLIYVAVSSPVIACQRVLARVGEGGHDVPPDKIKSRWLKSLQWLPWFAQRATAFWIIDNSNSSHEVAPHLIASGRFGKLEYEHHSVFPEMKRALKKVPRSML